MSDKAIRITVEWDGDDALYSACAHEGLPGMWFGYGETVASALRDLAATLEALPKEVSQARRAEALRGAKDPT